MLKNLLVRFSDCGLWQVVIIAEVVLGRLKLLITGAPAGRQKPAHHLSVPEWIYLYNMCVWVKIGDQQNPKYHCLPFCTGPNKDRLNCLVKYLH